MFGAPRHTAMVDPGLLDVVPWSYGFAHSWALAALLEDVRTQPEILAAVPDLPGARPHVLDGPIEREKVVGRRRADLAFTLVDAEGEHFRVAVETKVNDPFGIEQVRAYAEAGYVPVLYLPASTGILLSATPPTDANEIRFMPDHFLKAIDAAAVSLSPLLLGYVDALRKEMARAGRAKALAKGQSGEPVGEGLTPEHILANVAWITEIFGELPGVQDTDAASEKAKMRIEANDRGFFYSDSYAELTGGGALWVDVIADVRTGKRSVAVKAGGTDLVGAWEAASIRAPDDRGWRMTAKRLAGNTCTVWKLDCGSEVTAQDAANAAVNAASFIRSVRDS